ncbi:MAG TPA: MATE family efflux transporter [Candidatus Binatia bacterium]|jgi:MATE family multidrug resistance protein|nr:MATE family efflux transporter [Candidatus Binatia bacterium]
MRFPSRAGLREILHLALPIIASMASATVMSFIDTWMVALVGTAEVAAAMPAGIIAYTLTALPLGITQCVSTFTAQALGRGTPEEGSAFAWQGLYLSLAVGIACFVLWPAAPGFFLLFGHEPEVVALEVVYFRVRLWAVGMAVAVGALNGFFYGIHRPLIPLIAMVVDNVVNVLLCYVLIFGKLGAPALGLTGAALAFVLSYAVQVTVLLWAFLSEVVHQQFSTRTAWQWAWPRFRQLVHIGWPVGLQSAVDVLGWGVLIVLMVGRFGKEQLAASNITIQYMMISFMPGIGLAQALTALVGRYIGEGRIELAVQRVHETLCLALSYMVLMAVLYWTCRAPFIAFFNADPVVIRAGSNILLCAALFQVFDGMGYTFAGALRGAGDTHWTAGITVALLLGVFAPLSLGTVMFTDLQSLGPWLAGTAYVILLGLSLWWRFAQGKWREIDIFAAEERKKAVVLPSQEVAG